MNKKLLAFLRSLPTVAQNMRLSISLEGWPGAIAVWALSGAVIGVAAILASGKAEDETIPDKEESPDKDLQDLNDASTEGAPDEADDFPR